MQEKRIIFVGIHFKTGMEALDSKTKSGKLIDKCIGLIDISPEQGVRFVCSKTNLINGESMPDPYNPELEAHQWAIREKFDASTDIIVALGKDVQKAFRIAGFKNVVAADHPARVKPDHQFYYIHYVLQKVIDLC
jgi:hypothetical protein